jgi:uncharacterized membrane protein (Fun14 family)
VGEFLKKFSKKLAVYCGGAMMFLAILNYKNWISINWKQIDKDLLSLLFRGYKEATGFVAYITRTFTHVLPMSAGIFIGFKYSMGTLFPGAAA